VKKRSLSVPACRKLRAIGSPKTPSPHQPIAVDAGKEHEPDQRHARDPRERAKALEAPERQLAQQVQRHREHQAVGGITVQAAHYAARVPLLAREVFDRAERAGGTGLEEDVEIDPARGHDPEQKKREPAEVVHRAGGAEDALERVFEARERAADRGRLLGQGGSLAKGAGAPGITVAFRSETQP